MSDTYKEAIVEARKLRELAELDAKNSIIEAIAPHIKNIISKEAGRSFIFEEEELGPEGETTLPPTDEVPQPGLPAGEFTPAGGQAPIIPTGSETVDVPLPDEEGKITVDFEQLFVEPGETQPVAPVDTTEVKPGEEIDVTAPVEPPPEEPVLTEPAPETMPAPEEEVPVEEEEPMVAENFSAAFKVKLIEIAKKIDNAYKNGRVSDVVQESIRNKLFVLLENVDNGVRRGFITRRQAKINEQKLEYLFLKLKEAGLQNTYSKGIQKKDKEIMSKSLKEFAAKLFESEDEEHLGQDSATSGKIGLATHKKATEHAKSVSGMQVDGFWKGGHKDVPTDTEEEGWEEGEPLKEQAEEEAEEEPDEGCKECSAGFGDTGEKPVASPELFYEIDEAELKEAVRAIRKENIMKKMRAVKEQVETKVSKDEGWEEGEPEGGDDPSKKVLKKEKLSEQAEEEPDEGMEEDLVLSVDLPDEVEDELDVDDLDVELDLVEPEEEEGLEVEEEPLEGGEEEFEVEEEPVEGEEEERELLHDEGMEEEMEEEPDEALRLENRKLRRSVLESRRMLSRAKKLHESQKVQAAETNLFLSKLLYLNKFLQLEGLSRKQKQQIVEYLDKATTVAEAKDIYNKIMKKLNESSVVSRRVAGSASRPTGTGSARLTESRSLESSGENPVVGSVERWQVLAGIAKKDK